MAHAYPEFFVEPMREELTRSVCEELRTAATSTRR
jgi:hypothetical protein